VLKVENLSITYIQNNQQTDAVKEASFALEPGQALGIIGESGSGKTTLGLAIMGILNSNAKVNGKIEYNGVNLRELSYGQLKKYRWKHIAMVFQNGLETLNPLLTIKEQIIECIMRLNIKEKEANRRVKALLEQVGLEIFVADCYPHQLSGGMRQKVLIAMALACDPKLLIVDEPTSSLDAISKAEIVRLLAKLQREKRFSMIVISHDFSVITSLTSKICVMYRGCIVEEGLTRDILKNPLHTYTRGLINSSPSINPYQDLWGIPPASKPAASKGCPFYPRCSQRLDVCKDKKPKLEYVSLERKVACNQGGIVTLLKAGGIDKTFTFKGCKVCACKNCHMNIRAGEIVALIGQSGSGKTTLASILSGYIKPDRGNITFLGQPIKPHELTCKLKGIQMVFQDPFSSINDRFTVKQAVMEPFDILKLYSLQERKERVKKALSTVELPTDEDFLNRYCFTLSGGQRQRVSIARSLILEPKLLIADEISSMLDPSTQANILRLLKGLQNSFGFAMLYITHDLDLARKIADKLYIMHQGEIVEQGPAWEVFENPSNEYTRKLITSAGLL